MTSTASTYNFDTLDVTSPADKVLRVELNRPEKRNAMNAQFFKDIKACFQKVADDTEVRAVILSASGKIFTAGLDLMSFATSLMPGQGNAATENSRRAMQLQALISELQESFQVIERCPQPVIAAVHSACVGGGVDLICTCDIRWCTNDTWISIKEVDIGLAADLGTLQRLPKVIGNDSLVRELAYSARSMYSDEALSAGLFSRRFEDKGSMMTSAIELAKIIASKSPVAVYGTKHNLNYSRDTSVRDGLEHMVTWNSAMLQSEDLMRAVQAFLAKQEPEYNDLPPKSKL